MIGTPGKDATVLRLVAILILIYAGIAAQCSLQWDGPLFGRPFLPALLLVLIGAWCHPANAVFWSGLAGLMLDGASTERLGVQLGLASVLALGLQLFRSLWGSCRALPLAAAILTVTAFWRTLSPMTYAVLTGRIVNPQTTLNIAVRDAVATALVGLLISLVLRGLVRTPNRIGTSVSSTGRQSAFATR